MKVTNYGLDHPFAVIRGRVAGVAAVGTATLTTLNLVVITPTTLTANTDDWNPTGLSTADIIRASTNASWNLTGIVAPGDDRIIILDNIGSFDLVIKHNVTSTAANRFLCPGDTDLTLTPDTNVWLQYDLASLRWRIIGGTGTGSIPAGTYELAIEGGQDAINPRGTLGATETIDPTLGNTFSGTLDQDCTVTLGTPVGTGQADLYGWISQDGTGGWVVTFAASGGGSVTMLGGTADTTASTTVRYLCSRAPGTTDDWIINLLDGGIASPLTTKGDIWGYSTVNARIPVGTDGQVLTADSTVALGVSYQTNSGVAHYVVMASGISPPDPVISSDGLDWTYTS